MQRAFGKQSPDLTELVLGPTVSYMSSSHKAKVKAELPVVSTYQSVEAQLGVGSQYFTNCSWEDCVVV